MGSEKTVGDYVTLQRGTTYKGNLVGAPGPALLGLGSIVPGGGFRESDFKTYGGDCPDKLMLYPGDLFVSLKGATKDGKMIGSIARVPDSVSSGRLTQDTVKLEFHDSDPEFRKYLYWILRTPQYREYCAQRATGSAVVALSREDFLDYVVPPFTIDRKEIVAFLENQEQKIALNRQINTTLESMAQALFKSWFVDFDPVIDNALAAGNDIPEPLQARAEKRAGLHKSAAAYPALPDEIKQLFPDSFVFTEDMGWVPEGWEVKPLSQILCINPKASIKKGTVATYVDMKALPTSGFMIDEAVDKAFSGGAKFQNRDVLLARITPCLENGKTGLVDFLANDEVGFGSTEFIVLREKGAITMPFIASLSRHPEFRNHCVLNMVGSSGRQRVQNACFDSYFVSTPADVQLLELFDKVCSSSFEKMTKCREEARGLADLRDSLLPKLLSGQLSIPEAEQSLDQVV